MNEINGKIDKKIAINFINNKIIDKIGKLSNGGERNFMIIN